MVNELILIIALKYAKQFPSDLEVNKVFLFGSCAKAEENDDSDIDIAVIINNMKDFFATQMQLMRLRRDVDLRIEPHPINAADFNEMNPFACEIMKKGIELNLN